MTTIMPTTLLQHLPELLPLMKMLLVICPGERKLRVTLLVSNSGFFPHRSTLTLPIMSSRKFSELAALKTVEFCNLTTWKVKVILITGYQYRFHSNIHDTMMWSSHTNLLDHWKNILCGFPKQHCGVCCIQIQRWRHLREIIRCRN